MRKIIGYLLIGICVIGIACNSLTVVNWCLRNNVLEFATIGTLIGIAINENSEKVICDLLPIYMSTVGWVDTTLEADLLEVNMYQAAYMVRTLTV